MEFFQQVEFKNPDIVRLKELLTIKSLPDLCGSIDTVLADSNDQGEIYCLWGQFTVGREVIRYGVRFSLLNCPHALAWTVTFNEFTDEIVIHCTIDKKEQDKDFIDSIDQFVDDWRHGLCKALQ